MSKSRSKVLSKGRTDKCWYNPAFDIEEYTNKYDFIQVNNNLIKSSC
jgi:hypothetical protein